MHHDWNEKIRRFLVQLFLPNEQLLLLSTILFPSFLLAPVKTSNVTWIETYIKRLCLALNCLIVFCNAEQMLLNSFCFFSIKFDPNPAFCKVTKYHRIRQMHTHEECVILYIVVNNFNGVVKSFVKSRKRKVLHVLQRQYICKHILSDNCHAKMSPWSCSAQNGCFLQDLQFDRKWYYKVAIDHESLFICEMYMLLPQEQ